MDHLYQDLMKLTQENDAFYYVDHVVNGKLMRVFSYRLASYEDFLLPGALECRGHTFCVKDCGTAELVSLPMQKYFNWNENPFTTNIDPNRIKHIMTKEDGSLISVSWYDGDLLVKSKTSFTSEQALAARQLIEQDEAFKHDLASLARIGMTINMEYTAPDNRIVLAYEKPALTVLNVRDNKTGEYISREECAYFSTVYDRWVKYHEVEDKEAFVKAVPDMEGIEGFVYVLDDGQMVKQKCNFYLTLHRARDEINNPKKIFESVIMESVDDLKSLFHNDPLTLKMIADIETKAIKEYNRMIARVEAFYQENKHLDRKEYAIKARGLGDGFFSLYMNKYIQRPEGYKDYALKYPEKFIG